MLTGESSRVQNKCWDFRSYHSSDFGCNHRRRWLLFPIALGIDCFGAVGNGFHTLVPRVCTTWAERLQARMLHQILVKPFSGARRHA